MSDSVNYSHAVVSGNMPFYDSGDARRYARTINPENPDSIMEHNPELCASLASRCYDEVVYLFDTVNDMLTEARHKLETLATERDNCDTSDLLGSVHAKVIQENVLRQSGYCGALHDVWVVLHSRKFELMKCSRY